MNYLVVCQTNGQYYLLLTQENAISAYASKEEVMQSFKGYTEKLGCGDYTWHMSATLGFIQMCPVAIKAPEDIEDIRKYIVEQRAFQMSGGAIGRGYRGMPVTKDILDLKEFDIMSQSIKESGI